jgi:hypothetical protein
MNLLNTFFNLFDPTSSHNHDGYRAQRSGHGVHTRKLRTRAYRQMRRRLAKAGRRASQ